MNRKKNGKYKVGDVVAFHFGSQEVQALVIEDRGRLGVKGRRLYRIRLERDPEPIEFEMPEDDLKAVNLSKT